MLDSEGGEKYIPEAETRSPVKPDVATPVENEIQPDDPIEILIEASKIAERRAGELIRKNISQNKNPLNDQLVNEALERNRQYDDAIKLTWEAKAGTLKGQTTDATLLNSGDSESRTMHTVAALKEHRTALLNEQQQLINQVNVSAPDILLIRAFDKPYQITKSIKAIDLASTTISPPKTTQ